MSRILEETLKNLKGWATDEQELHQLQEAIKQQEELKKLLQPVKAFPDSELTEVAKNKRLKKASKEFWFFDKTYFPPEIYEDYAAPSFFHKDIISIASLKDKKAHVFHGPRDGGKTITMKKYIIWAFLFGKRKLMAVASQTLTTPHAFLLDVIYLVDTNERIAADFSNSAGESELFWSEKSTERLYARSRWNPQGTFVSTISEGRSARGLQRMLSRPDFIYVTDFENLESSFTNEAIEKRLDRLNEMRTTLSQSGTLLWEGNNFDVDCAMNRIRTDSERNILTEEYVFHHHPAWSESRKEKNFWPAKYKAQTLEELKKIIQPKDEYDWLGNYQGTPEARSGEIFPNQHFNTFRLSDIPKDVIAVVYVDQNLSLKRKGDTTAITCFGFSPSSQKYYVPKIRCKSYDVSNDLLTDLLEVFFGFDKRLDNACIGMDGNVSQESVWTNNITNFTIITGYPYPYVVFKRYNVDNLATPVEDLYKQGVILFEENISKTEEGKTYLKQFHNFRLKKANKKDDAPDSLICAYTLLSELGYAYLVDNSKPFMLTIKKNSRRI